MSQLSDCAFANRQADCHLKINIAFDNDSDSILSLQPYPKNNVDILYEESIGKNIIENLSCKTSVIKPILKSVQEESKAMPIWTETNECFIKLEDSDSKNHPEYYFKFRNREETLVCKKNVIMCDYSKEPAKACQSIQQTEPVKPDTFCITSSRFEMFMELEYLSFLDSN